ncbi:uncharacterized protein PRCAT00003125001 [Priceomyces carsonii]|uniref:uncharacterized protein n=1 Tax=Priceomyces carsonii TaxID=28549 RepID=UPI002ED87243|nr:unnamed protein product [Priceomyces carsonii]
MNVTDRRRVLAPGNISFPSLGISSDGKAEAIKTGPNDKERKMFLKRGFIENANGSAYLEIGKTIIEVSVYGPRPIKGSFVERASFSVETKFLPYLPQPEESVFNGEQLGTSGKTHNSSFTNVEQKVSNYVETSLLPTLMLNRYPKSTIDLFINVISTEDNILLTNLLSWIVNCSSIALVDAEIEMKDIVTSGQALLKLQSNEILNDHVQKTDDFDSVECIISFMNLRNDEIVGLLFEGSHVELDEGMISKLIDTCNETAKQIRSNINFFLMEDSN